MEYRYEKLSFQFKDVIFFFINESEWETKKV